MEVDATITLVADLDDELYSTWGLFTWMSTNDDLSEAQQENAALAASILDGTYTSSLRNGTSVTYEDLVNNITLGEGATTLENFSEALDMIDTGNSLRTTDEIFTNNSDLTVLASLMAIAELQTSCSTYLIGHTKVFNVGENLAWATWSTYDPYESTLGSWYTTEKAVYIETAQSLGYTSYEDMATYKTAISNAATSDVGHYTNLCSSSYWATRTAYTGVKNSEGYYTWGQTFTASSSLWGTGDADYTTNELRTILEEYEEYLDELEEEIILYAKDGVVTSTDVDTSLTYTATVEGAGGTKTATVTFDEDGNATIVYSADELTLLESEHTYVSETTITPTCTEAGEITYTCSFCGYIYTEEVDALGHSYDDGAVTTEPTCTEEGEMTYTCTVCGDTYTESIEAMGHSYESEVTEPTCTEEGYTTYTCSACGDSYTSDYTDAFGHSYDDGEVTTEPTCTEEGEIIYTCTMCGNTYAESIEKIAHTYSEPVTSKAATCTEDGELTYTCDVCGESYTETLSALGHNYESETTKEATCEEEGEITYTCTICGDVYTEVIAALGHDYDDGVITTEATSETEGVITYTCQNCGKTYTETIDKLSSTANGSSSSTDDIPETGDENNFPLWIFLGVLSVIVLAAAIFIATKKKQKEK